ncbi:MAG: hypothetical protein KAV82_10620 [Phycisphaerae bacterium]|nr:hypothetical protein [Phycisphaerae bacterium]
MSQLPPNLDIAQLELELRFVPGPLKPDAVQEAWIAHLDGRSPVLAVKAFAERERRYRRRVQTNMTTVN